MPRVSSIALPMIQPNRSDGTPSHRKICSLVLSRCVIFPMPTWTNDRQANTATPLILVDKDVQPVAVS